MKIPQFNPQEVLAQPLARIESGVHSRLDSLNIGVIKNALQGDQSDQLLNSDARILHESPRAASVLVLLIERSNDFDVVFTQRAAHLKHHAGQISFVGGAVEGSESALEAALREANEEIGLNRSHVHILGRLPIYHTITGFAVTPIVASISAQNWDEQEVMIDEQEVDHVLTIPLSILLDHELIHVHEYEWQNHRRRFYSVRYNGYFIWGASMAMLRNLDIMLRSN